MKGNLLVAGAITLAAVAIACTEDVPTSPKAKTPDASEITREVVAALSCHASVVERSVTCDAPVGSSTRPSNPEVQPGPANIIIGGQHVFVEVTTTNVNYDGGTGAFTFDTKIRNLIPQPLGTADTTGAEAPDPDGIRIFFAAGPNATSGSGIITVSGDGTATFTAAGQPYYQYSTVLDQFEVSSAKTWQLNMPPTVLNFDFILLVSAAVPRPDGYIDLDVSTLRPPVDRQMSFFVRNANGTIVGSPGTINWSVSDTTRATIDANGLVNPLRAGPVTIIATNGLRVGSLTVDVKAIRRIWTGSTDNHYENGANWYPDGIKPVAADTAVVPDTVTTSFFPNLFQNEDIAGVEVLDITPGGTVPFLQLNAFNLNASGDVLVTNSGSIQNTSGTLLVTGIGRTIAGVVPFLRVTGTYSLNGNVTARAPLRVDLGRLTNTAFRVQATSN
jgi:hypothetical protein